VEQQWQLEIGGGTNGFHQMASNLFRFVFVGDQCNVTFLLLILQCLFFQIKSNQILLKQKDQMVTNTAKSMIQPIQQNN